MSCLEPIQFLPIYQTRVWGGRRLQEIYGRDLPSNGQPYGESWELVDRETEQSVVVGGSFDGMTLHALWTDHREEIFGSHAATMSSERFPLLMKILDARDRLSIQVHPPATVADELGGEPKTEMWYIAHAEPDAELYVGLKNGVSRDEFEVALRDGKTEQVVHQIPVSTGEFIFIPSGRLHAIGAGLVIFEIQQNSDTTYRVFDWNRLGLDGKARELHIDESLRCIDFADHEPTMDRGDGEQLVACEHFRVERWNLNGSPRAASSAQDCSIFAVIGGCVRCGAAVFREGDFFLAPAGEALMIAANETEQAAVLRVGW